MQDRYRRFTIVWFTILLFVALHWPCHSYTANSEVIVAVFEVVVTPSSDSILLLTPDTYCRDTDPIILTVTGDNITWYADAAKTTKLAQGNSFNPAALNKTTTYYLTQTINGIESPVKAITIEIVEFFLTNVATTPASCGKNDGTMTVTAKGGSASYPLQYRLDDGPLQLSPVFIDLSGGTYKLTIHAVNCWGTTDIIVGQQPSPLIAAIDSVAPQCSNTDGSLRITAYSGTGQLTYSLDGTDFKADNLFENLAGGLYTVTVRDENLCRVSQSVSLKKSVRLELDTVEVVHTSCGKANGEVTITAGGNGRLTYSLTGLPEQSAAVFDNLQAGSYLVSVQDEVGCSGNRKVIIASSQAPVISLVKAQPPGCGLADGHLTVTATGSTGLYYSLDDGPYQQDSSFKALSFKNYTVSVKDEAGCTAERGVDMGLPCAEKLSLPTSFTPNHDGINDVWAVFFPFENMDLQELAIYNRWGEVVYHSSPGRVQSGQVLWDGNYKGVTINGFFTYQLKLQLSSGQSYTYRGTIMVP